MTTQEDIKKEDLAFLSYIDRSGSTYLSKLLNEYRDVGVSIEAVFPDGILGIPVIIKSESQIDKALNKIYSDTKFQSWGIDRKKLTAEIKSLDEYPLGFNKLLPIFLKLYFETAKSNACIHIYKSSFIYLQRIKKVRQMFPESKFIFIIRDGRAIYNSQKKSLDSKKGKPFADNPFRTAKKFTRAEKIVKKYRSEKWFHLVKYEDLITDANTEIDKLLRFLGLSKFKKSDNKDYFKAIPKSQKSLHENLQYGPLRKRINAWKEELNKDEIYIFQNACSKALMNFNYSLEPMNFHVFKKIYIYLKFKLHYVFKRIIDETKVFFYPNLLLRRIWYRFSKIKKAQ